MKQKGAEQNDSALDTVIVGSTECANRRRRAARDGAPKYPKIGVAVAAHSRTRARLRRIARALLTKHMHENRKRKNTAIVEWALTATPFVP